MITSKQHVKSLTHSIHKAIKAKPNMGLSELRELFSDKLVGSDWNGLLDMLDEQEVPCSEDVVHGRAFSFDCYEKQGALNYSPSEMGTLSPALAKELIDIFYETDFWFLAPFQDGIFDSKDEALAFVDAFPNHPLSIVVSTNSNMGAVSVLVNSDEEGYYFREEDDYTVIERYRWETTQSLVDDLQEFMTTRAIYEHNNKDSYAIPFLKKGTPFDDYVNNGDYRRSEEGFLTMSHAIELCEAVYQSKGYALGALNRQTFSNKGEALRFIRSFKEHPLTLVVSLYEQDSSNSCIGAAMSVNSTLDGDLLLADYDEHSPVGSVRVRSLEQLNDKLPELIRKRVQANHPTHVTEIKASVLKIG
jgi:hypothetical protein